MTLDDDTLAGLETWWTSLSAEERALVRKYEHRPTGDERVRELVGHSGYEMIDAGAWYGSQLYRMPLDILDYLQDPTTLDH